MELCPCRSSSRNVLCLRVKVDQSGSIMWEKFCWERVGQEYVWAGVLGAFCPGMSSSVEMPRRSCYGGHRTLILRRWAGSIHRCFLFFIPFLYPNARQPQNWDNGHELILRAHFDHESEALNIASLVHANFLVWQTQGTPDRPEVAVCWLRPPRFWEA